MSQQQHHREAPIPGQTGNTSHYLRSSEAALYVGHSESTLAKLRMQGSQSLGPKFIKRGGIVLYRRPDLDDWLNAFVVG